MIYILATTALALHSIFLGRFILFVTNRKMPDALGFLGLGLFIYYDIGIIFEMFTDKYQNLFFRSLFSRTDSSSIYALLVIIIFPILFYFGWLLAGKISIRPNTHKPKRLASSIVDRRLMGFIIFATIVSCGSVIFGLGYLRSSSNLWSARLQLSNDLGPAIVILRLPIALLCFWIVQQQARTKSGKVFSVFLAIAAILVNFSMGQRTTVLLPILILLIFSRISLPRFVLFGTVMILASAFILPAFKWQYQDQQSKDTLIYNTVFTDLHRANILAETVENAMDGSNAEIIPYPGAGYTYGALLYIPRPLVPFKGYGTSSYYTAWKTGEDVEGLRWALALSSIDEMIINFGLLGLLATIPLGFLFYFLDKSSLNWPAYSIPIKLSVVWLCGYDISVVINLFFTIFIFVYILNLVFCRNISVYRVRSSTLLTFQR